MIMKILILTVNVKYICHVKRRTSYILMILVGLFFNHFTTHGQDFEVNEVDSLPLEIKLLLKPNNIIKESNVLNEQLLDLVQICVVDSVLIKEKERHRFFGSLFFHWIGWNWRAVSMKKQKYVGTVLYESGKPKKDEFTEYDVNFDIYSQLGPYQEIAYEAKRAQKDIGKKSKKNNYNAEPFTPLTDSSDLTKYKLHCELTPHEDYREALNQHFYPCLYNTKLAEHKNFLEANPSMGVYGAVCLDCTHSCHAELHPYEWIWWLNVNETFKTPSYSKSWYAGLFKEGSNRFPNWSAGPKRGEISVPFIFNLSERDLTIEINHLVENITLKDTSTQSNEEPLQTFDFYEKIFVVKSTSLGQKAIKIKSNKLLNRKNIQWTIKGIAYNKKANVMYGWLVIRVETTDMYTVNVRY